MPEKAAQAVGVAQVGAKADGMQNSADKAALMAERQMFAEESEVTMRL